MVMFSMTEELTRPVDALENSASYFTIPIWFPYPFDADCDDKCVQIVNLLKKSKELFPIPSVMLVLN